MDVGKGVNIDVRAGEVIIRFPVDGNHGRSASGKSTIVATTSGNVMIPGTDITIGLNAYRK